MLSILPAPQEVRALEGQTRLRIDDVSRLVELLEPWAPRAARSATRLLSAGDEPSVDGDTSRPRIVAVLDAELAPESYTLHIDGDEWALRAGDQAGAFWAVQVLGQACADGNVPHFECTDSPKHPLRGFMLDIARHFFGVSDIEKVIDLISSYRFNTLHLHLSDDQGWRLEIEERPLLTERASIWDVSRGAGGFLTTGDYMHLQEYALERHVTIVPEVGFPGHTHAALIAYPEISPDDEVREPYLGDDVGFSAVDLTSDASWAFIDDVVGSVARKTLGSRIHLGGDEAHTLQRDDYLAFVERLGGLVASHGKELVMWQEAAGADLPPGSTIQYWDPKLDATHLADVAVTQHVKFIASPGDRAYLDHLHAEGDPFGQTWAGAIDLRQAYEWDPANELPGVPTSSIIGVEACLWTEYVTTFDRLTTMLLPRLPAVAEVAWGSPQDWERFSEAVVAHSRSWEGKHLAFYRSTQLDWS